MSMMGHTYFSLTLTFAMFFGTLSAQPSPSRQKPNVIFILADDLGWGDLSCYGGKKVRTANIDSLAASGSLFTQFYQTAGVCSPSRASLLTGRFPAQDSIHGHLADHPRNMKRGMPDFLNPSLPTLTKLLRQHGYTTGHFGKWHLGSGSAAPDLRAYGFDVYKMSNFNSDEAWALGEPSTQMDIGSKDKRPFSSKLVVDEAMHFLEENKDRPFYLNAWFLDVHATLNPSADQMSAVKHLGPGDKVPFRSPAEIYYGTLLEMDRQVGRLLSKLRELGLEKNTIVIFSSDNGPEDINVINAAHSGVGSTGPLRGRKRSLYEGGIRVPFIISWPGRIASGKVNANAIISGADILPTICALTDTPIPAGVRLDGQDCTSIFTGGSAERVKPLMWEWRYNMPGHLRDKSPTLAIREGHWKFLVNHDGSRPELYDLRKDQMEMTNVADIYPETRQKLMDKLLIWQKSLPPAVLDSMAGRLVYPWPSQTKINTKK
jgi:N-acetylgalactosamine-6-sulfatase